LGEVGHRFSFLSLVGGKLKEEMRVTRCDQIVIDLVFAISNVACDAVAYAKMHAA